MCGSHGLHKIEYPLWQCGLPCHPLVLSPAPPPVFSRAQVRQRGAPVACERHTQDHAAGRCRCTIRLPLATHCPSTSTVEYVGVGAKDATEQHVENVDGPIVRAFLHLVHLKPVLAAAASSPHFHSDAAHMSFQEEALMAVDKPDGRAELQTCALFLPPDKDNQRIQHARRVKVGVRLWSFRPCGRIAWHASMELVVKDGWSGRPNPTATSHNSDVVPDRYQRARSQSASQPLGIKIGVQLQPVQMPETSNLCSYTLRAISRNARHLPWDVFRTPAQHLQILHRPTAVRDAGLDERDAGRRVGHDQQAPEADCGPCQLLE
jgi:hypothetical protein